MTDAALLSVAELQQGYRDLLRDARAGRRPEPVRSAEGATDLGTSTRNHGPGADPNDTGVPDVPAGWIAVVAAHAGAGASTIALALVDAAAGDGRAAYLIESAGSDRSGLAAASRSELGVAADGRWRTGRRAGVTIVRRVGEPGVGWPASVGDADQFTVLDLGLGAPRSCTRLAVAGTTCVVVCRATVPGVRSAERVLEALATVHVVVAVLGPGRWPGEVTSSFGPRLRHLRTEGHVVAVPVERHLEITGPTQTSLPKTVLAAGRSLLELVDPDHHDARADASAAPRRAPRATGTPR